MARDLLELVNTGRAVFNSLSAAILLISGLSIANVMVLVTESRRVPLAVLKAIGATSGEIFLTYLTVAAAYALLGYALGYPVAVLAARAIGTITVKVYTASVTIEPVFTPGQALGALAYSLAISTLSSAYSAYRASRVEPAEVIRFG